MFRSVHTICLMLFAERTPNTIHAIGRFFAVFFEDDISHKDADMVASKLLIAASDTAGIVVAGMTCEASISGKMHRDDSST